MNDFKSYIINKYKTNVTDLTDYPSDDGVSAEQLKAIFDGRTNEEVKDSINGIIGALLASTAAEQIGAKGGTVEEVLNTKVDKEGAVTSVAGMTGAVTLSKIDVGLERVDNTADVDKPVSNPQRAELDKKADAENPKFTSVVQIGSSKIYMDAYGTLCIEKPETTTELGVPNFGGTLSIDNGALLFNGIPVGSECNVKDLTVVNNTLTEVEKANFMTNTGLDKTVGDIETSIGDIETAIDEIIEIQNNLIGGDA